MRRDGKTSAGMLMFRRRGEEIEVLLAHPGGPFFQKKDAGAWSIPKGEIEGANTPLQTALREFEEETGISPCEPFIPLGRVQQKGGKTVWAWAFEGDWPAGQALHSNYFSLEWPPRSGRIQQFPEVDRVELFDLDTARSKINQAQVELIDALKRHLGGGIATQ